MIGKLNVNPRARQNVILELGFFLGKLDRQWVCPLVKGDMETPSDYDGVVYTRLDDVGAWKMQLVQEVKAADFDDDANKVIQT
ncbi:MAG: nucleotide-binding protein [Rhodospirillales bacterium]|nr:nucleotide-binding protein [Rhodospirillales bacterium]